MMLRERLLALVRPIEVGSEVVPGAVLARATVRSHVIFFAGIWFVCGGCGTSHRPEAAGDAGTESGVDAAREATCDAGPIASLDAGDCIVAPPIGSSVTLRSELGPGDALWHRPTGESCPSALDSRRRYALVMYGQ